MTAGATRQPREFTPLLIAFVHQTPQPDTFAMMVTYGLRNV